MISGAELNGSYSLILYCSCSYCWFAYSKPAVFIIINLVNNRLFIKDFIQWFLEIT